MSDKKETKETKTRDLTSEMKVAQQLFSSVADKKQGESTWNGIIHDKFIFKHPKFPSLNKKQFIDVHMALAAAFPDLDYGVNPAEWEELNERKGLRATYRFTGTHTGAAFTPFHDCPEIAATHIRVALPDEHTIIIVEDGKIVEIDVDENNTLLSGPIGFYISIGGKMPRPDPTQTSNMGLASPLASSAPASASFCASKIAPSSPAKDCNTCQQDASCATTSSSSSSCATSSSSSASSSSSSASASSSSASSVANLISHLTVDDDED